MDERELLKLELAARGTSAVEYFVEMLEKCKQEGDKYGEGRWAKKLEQAEIILKEQAERELRLSEIDPNKVTLYGAIAGAQFSDHFDLGHGIEIKRTYAHVFASFMLSFEKAKRGSPSPGPWKSAGTNIAFDVNAEIVLPINSNPTKFDSLNTIWWITSLLRLHHSRGLRIPVISDISFSEIKSSANEPKFWPTELNWNQFTFDGYDPKATISVDALKWTKQHFVSGASLMENESFNSAFSALASSQFASDLSSAKLLVWSSLEALFRPGRVKITKTLAAMVATFLIEDISERNRQFNQIIALYEARGLTMHSAHSPAPSDVKQSFDLARACFIKTIENSALPDPLDLLDRWRQGKP